MRLDVNRSGRDFFIGDLHGQPDQLMSALDAVKFEPARDRVISVGDLVDRGPDSPACLALLAEPWFFAVRGNHEQMMVNYEAADAAERSRLRGPWSTLNGGKWFCDLAERKPEVATTLVRSAAKLPYLLEVEIPHGIIGVVHAGVPCRFTDWHELIRRCSDPPSATTRLADLEWDLLWDRERIGLRIERPISGVTAVVSGHTPVSQPTALANSLFIDTGAGYDSGRLTLMSTEDALRSLGHAVTNGCS